MIAGFDRYFQIAPCFRDEDARADRIAGRVLPARYRDELCDAGGRVPGLEPVLRGLFEEFGDGKPVTQKHFRASPYDEAIAKYGTDKPDLRNPIVMQDVSEHFRGTGFKVFAGMLERDAKARVWAIPAPGGGCRAFCDRMNGWAQQQGQPGLGYIFFARAKAGQGPSPRTSAKSARRRCRRSLASRKATRSSSSARRSGEVLQVRRRGAHQDRHRAEPRGQGPLRALLDRRLPLLRVGRGREEDRLLAQPVLDAAGRACGARRRARATRPAGAQGLPVRHRLQRRRALLRRDPQPYARDHVQGLRHRGLRAGSGGRAVRRHDPRAQVRRAAARGHRLPVSTAW